MMLFIAGFILGGTAGVFAMAIFIGARERG